MAVTGVDKGEKAKGKGEDVELSKDEKKATPHAEDALEAAQDELEEGPKSQILPEDDEELVTTSDYQSAILIGSGEYQLKDVVKEAKRDSGLTAAKWNDLDPKKRSAFIAETVERMKVDEQELINKARAEHAAEALGDVEQTDVHVHEDRGIGGRYVALGGGERIRVADASTAPDALILDDADLVDQQAGA